MVKSPGGDAAVRRAVPLAVALPPEVLVLGAFDREAAPVAALLYVVVVTRLLPCVPLGPGAPGTSGRSGLSVGS